MSLMVNYRTMHRIEANVELLSVTTLHHFEIYSNCYAVDDEFSQYIPFDHLGIGHYEFLCTLLEKQSKFPRCNMKCRGKIYTT